MAKAILLAALPTVLGLCAAPSLFAHGGVYPGPTDTVPPNLGEPGDTAPPGTNPGPITPPGAPGPTSGGTKGPTTGGVPRAPTAGARARAPTTGPVRPRGGASGFEQWEFWWEANDDAYLDLKERLRRLGVSTGATAAFAGRSSAGCDAKASRTTAVDQERIESALLAALESEEAEVADSAVLALARSARPGRAAALVPAVVRVLGHRQKSAREAAALALGVLGAPEAVPVLRALLLDQPEGRRATGQGAQVEVLVRAFAAASLGMIGLPEDAASLKHVVLDESLRAGADVKSLALLSLGLLRGAERESVPFLMQMMGDRGLDRIVRAQVPIALARIAGRPESGGAARAVLSSLIERFTDDKTDPDLRRSLAIALGRIAEIEDGEALSALADAGARATDAQTRHLALIALAEIGARDPDPERRAPEHRRLFELFRGHLVRPKPVTQRPWGALALAIHARHPRLDRTLAAEGGRKLLEVLADEPNPSYRGACAIALGLLGAQEARDDLRQGLVEARDPALRGYLAVALGLLLDRGRADEMRLLLVQKGIDARFRLQLARALGLIGDPGAVGMLTRNLEQAETTHEVASTAQALGLIGDRSAVEPLIALLGDGEQAPLRRGFAAVALGLVAERTELPWNAIFTVNSNYRARTPALAEIFDIL